VGFLGSAAIPAPVPPSIGAFVANIGHLIGPGEPADLGSRQRKTCKLGKRSNTRPMHLHRVQEPQAAKAGDLCRQIGQCPSRPAWLSSCRG